MILRISRNSPRNAETGYLMYVCNCNGLTERHVKEAIGAGARKWSDVHAHYGCEPQCGSCGPEITDAIKGARGCTVCNPYPSVFVGA